MRDGGGDLGIKGWYSWSRSVAELSRDTQENRHRREARREDRRKLSEKTYHYNLTMIPSEEVESRVKGQELGHMGAAAANQR